MSRRIRLSRLFLFGIPLGLTVVACGESNQPRQPRSLRAGDSLFERLTEAKIDAFPTTNLPKDALPSEKTVRILSPELGDWFAAGNIPPKYRSRLKEAPHIRYWRLRPDVSMAPDRGDVHLFKNGQRIPVWDPLNEPFPGEAFWWDPDSRWIRALHNGDPHFIQMEYWADTALEFGRFERQGLEDDEELAPIDLFRRIRFPSQSRSCLLLPAPGALRFDVDRFQGSGLSVSIGLVDRAYRRDGDRLERIPKASDGVTFAIEITTKSGVERVWESHLGSDVAGEVFVDDYVDLAEFRGTSISISLITEPGTAGDPRFDYALWSDLRIRGPSSPSARSPDQDRPNVVLIEVDTLRADRLGCYGYSRNTSPQIDKWARERATVYTNAKSTSSWTLPATASLLTGLAVSQHEVDRFPKAIRRDSNPLGIVHRRVGYETFAVVEQGFLSPTFGFDYGFDVYNVKSPKHADWGEALTWLESRTRERPFFLFLHTYLPHANYEFDRRFLDPHEPYKGPFAGRSITNRDVIEPVRKGHLRLEVDDIRYIDCLYDALVARVDDLVGTLLARLQELVPEEQLLIVLTSDHGEELYDHQRMGHGHTLYDELLHIPLIVQYPNSERPMRIDRSVSILDIYPTLLHHIGADVPRGLPGSFLDGPGSSTPRVGHVSSYNLQSVEMDGFKLILDKNRKSELLFNLDQDPDERIDLSGDRPEEVTRLTKLLRDYDRRFPSRRNAEWSQPSSARVKALQGLGYLGDPSEDGDR